MSLFLSSLCHDNHDGVLFTVGVGVGRRWNRRGFNLTKTHKRLNYETLLVIWIGQDKTTIIYKVFGNTLKEKVDAGAVLLIML